MALFTTFEVYCYSYMVSAGLSTSLPVCSPVRTMATSSLVSWPTLIAPLCILPPKQCFICTLLKRYAVSEHVHDQLTHVFLYIQIHIISVPKSTRFKSPLYLINLGLMLPHIAVILLQIMFRVNVVASEYPFHCTVGFDLPASAVALCYDVLISILYIAIFIKFYCFPNTAQQTAYQSSSLHMMAKRNAIAAIIALTTSSANFVILICLNGHERGLVASSVSALCLTIVCMVIHWGKLSTMISFEAISTHILLQLLHILQSFNWMRKLSKESMEINQLDSKSSNTKKLSFWQN